MAAALSPNHQNEETRSMPQLNHRDSTSSLFVNIGDFDANESPCPDSSKEDTLDLLSDKTPHINGSDTKVNGSPEQLAFVGHWADKSTPDGTVCENGTAYPSGILLLNHQCGNNIDPVGPYTGLYPQFTAWERTPSDAYDQYEINTGPAKTEADPTLDDVNNDPVLRAIALYKDKAE